MIRIKECMTVQTAPFQELPFDVKRDKKAKSKSKVSPQNQDKAAGHLMSCDDSYVALRNALEAEQRGTKSVLTVCDRVDERYTC